MSRTIALVPIRSLHGGKSRLAAVLDERQRSELVVALARQLLTTVAASDVADEIVVLTSDHALKPALKVEGIEFQADVPVGLNMAVDAGRRAALAKGANRLLVMFPDLPEVTPADVARVDQSRDAVTIVPDRHRDGTNTLLLQGAPIIGAFEFRYGPGSCTSHLTAACSIGEVGALLDVPGLALDLDTEDDWYSLSLETRSRIRDEIDQARLSGENAYVRVNHS